MRTEINDYIIIDSEIGHGKPTFKGTRVMVYTILEMLGAGASIKEILKAYPSISAEHIRAALQYASRLASSNCKKVSF